MQVTRSYAGGGQSYELWGKNYELGGQSYELRVVSMFTQNSELRVLVTRCVAVKPCGSNGFAHENGLKPKCCMLFYSLGTIQTRNEQQNAKTWPQLVL